MNYLTKTTYLHGRQCHKRYWLGRYAPEQMSPVADADLETIRLGQEVGRLARADFPGGILIDTHGALAVQQTQAAIRSGAPAIFEGAFIHDGALIRCDILVRENLENRAANLPDNLPRSRGEWTLIEVKSGTRIRDHHLHDIAIQAHVCRAAGLNLRRMEIMHINSRTCVYPDLSNLFHRTDVTEKVADLLDDVPQTIRRLSAILTQAEPRVAIGKHCNAPHACPFQSICWESVPKRSIFTIRNLSEEKLQTLVQQGIVDLCHISKNFPLTPAQRNYVDFVCAGEPRIDVAGIRSALAKLTYPLYFFDFETYATPIPNIPGTRPYQNYPFQYSCHVLHADGTLEHREYLHLDADDPRPVVARKLVEDLGQSGTVIAYFAQFERTVLRELAAAVPEFAPALDEIAARLWDQLAIIRSCYDHPAFLNSKSIKRVLPVLVPDLSYDDLAVQRGNEAQIAWRKMLATKDPELRAVVADDLRAYCRRDTYAMVRIHQVLENVG